MNASHIEKLTWTLGIEVSKCAKPYRYPKKKKIKLTLVLLKTVKVLVLVSFNKEPIFVQNFLNKQSDRVTCQKGQLKIRIFY